MPIYSNFFQGHSSSEYDQDGFDVLENIDVHTQLGTAKSQLALVKDSGSTITEAVILCVAPSGTVYAFSKTTGKIWKRSTAGSWSSVTANPDTSGHKGCAFYNGFIWYTTASILSRFAPDTEGSRVNSFGAYTNDSQYKPMVQHDNATKLYIGDGNIIASVNKSDNFSVNVLDLPSEQNATALLPFGIDLSIGTIVGSNVHSSKVYRWDTYSTTFHIPDEIDEIGVNTWIKSNNANIIFALAGTEGNIYAYTGNQLEFYKQFRDTTPEINPYNTTTLNGRSLVAIDDKIYSIYRKRRGLDFALAGEYKTSQGDGTTIHSMTTTGSTLLVAWEKAGTFGVDKIDTNRATGKITTPISIGKLSNVRVKYASLPTGTSIGIEVSEDGGAFTSKTVVVDARNNIVRLASQLKDVNSLRARITLNSSGANTPIIEFIELV